MAGLINQFDDDDAYASPELVALRRRLEDFGKSLDGMRSALATHSAQRQRLDHEWEEMLSAHAAKRAELERGGTLKGQMRESLRLDMDALRYSLPRWMFRNDTR